MSGRVRAAAALGRVLAYGLAALLAVFLLVQAWFLARIFHQ